MYRSASQATRALTAVAALLAAGTFASAQDIPSSPNQPQQTSSSVVATPLPQDVPVYSTVPPAPTPYPYTIQQTRSYFQTHGFDLAASVDGRY